jgi:hypothetical protein
MLDWLFRPENQLALALSGLITSTLFFTLGVRQ